MPLKESSTYWKYNNVDPHTAGRVWEYMKMQEKRKEVIN
jgi:hypothetical protein